MSTVAQKEVVRQGEKEVQKVEEYVAGIEPEKFWQQLANAIRGSIRITLEKAISYEFSRFIGALEYERCPERRDVCNGRRKRNFETVYGVLEDIAIPRARKSSFTSMIVPRFQRRQGRIGRLIAKIFLLGLSTRNVKKVSKHIYGKTYSPGLVSRFNKELGGSSPSLAGEAYRKANSLSLPRCSESSDQEK